PRRRAWLPAAPPPATRARPHGRNRPPGRCAGPASLPRPRPTRCVRAPSARTQTLAGDPPRRPRAGPPGQRPGRARAFIPGAARPAGLRCGRGRVRGFHGTRLPRARLPVKCRPRSASHERGPRWGVAGKVAGRRAKGGAAALPGRPRTGAERRGSWPGAVAGVGLMGACDDIVCHRLLQWHHFYVHTTAYWQVFSDGLFHLFTTTMLFAAVMLLWAQRRELATVVGGASFWSGLLLGAGAFQLFDGVVDHKVLGLHQVRMGADPLWPYDLGWLLGCALLLAAGLVVRRPTVAD